MFFKFYDRILPVWGMFMNNIWVEYVKKYKLVNKNNRLSSKDNLKITKNDCLIDEYRRKMIMKPFKFDGYIQFLRSVRDLIVPLTVSTEIRCDLYSFINEANRNLGLLFNDNFHFYIHSGYRSYKYQKNMYDNVDVSNRKFTAIAGASEHQTGLSVDFGLRNGKIDCDLRDKTYNEAIELLKDLAPKFGFILRYPKGKELFTGFPEEKWHFRYVGERALDITKYDLSYEEYVIASFIIYNNISLDELYIIIY